jgi:hypothetical protein
MGSAIFGALSQFAFRKLRGAEVSREESSLGFETGKATAEWSSIAEKHGTTANTNRDAAIVLGGLSIAAFLISLFPAYQAVQ